MHVLTTSVHITQFDNAVFINLFKGLVTNYREGGATKREGGSCEVLPLRKGGGGRKKF